MERIKFCEYVTKMFNLRGEPVKIIDTEEKIVFEADLTIPGIPLKLNDEISWEKEVVEFLKTLEDEHTKLDLCYHRKSRNTAYNEYNVGFMWRNLDQWYPIQISFYLKEDGTIDVKQDTDPFIKIAKKGATKTVEALEKNIEILQRAGDYFEKKPLVSAAPAPKKSRAKPKFIGE